MTRRITFCIGVVKIIWAVSSGGEYYRDMVKVAGSNPAQPIKIFDN